MKKKLLYLFLFIGFIASAQQTDYFTALASNGSSSQNGRAPQGFTRYNRSIWLITSAEMAAADFTNGTIVNGIGFNYFGAQDIPTTGNIIIYLQNTTDTANTKSTTWATAITGMTTVNNSSVTIPAAVGTFDIPFAGGSPFTYTGDGVYVAFDYQNASNPTATVPNSAWCTNNLVSGLNSAFSQVSAPPTVTASNFRPETRLGKSVPCSRPTNISEIIAAKTTTSVTGTWSNGNLTSLEYGPYGFALGTGTTINGITSPYVLSGLSPSSVYDVYFYNNCGTPGSPIYSNITDVETFHTVFEATNPTYNSGFEHEDFPYIGWLASPDNTANAWFINFGGMGSPLVQEGENSAAVFTPTATPASERLFSRGINLTANSTVTITYYVRNYQANGSTGTANYQLTVGAAQTSGSQTTVIATETGISNTVSFIQKTHNFVTPSTGTYYFSFLHNSAANPTGQHALIIDNFNVSEVLSTSDYLYSKISLYPNPANNFVTIGNGSAIEINKISIVDINGRVIKSLDPNKTTDIEVNISDLTSGVYFMNIKTADGSITKKIVKE